MTLPSQDAPIRFFAQDACLASRLTEELCTLSHDERTDTQVVLPTARLANRISAQACRKLGAWYEPRFFTFESFIDHHATRFGSELSLPPAASDSEATLLLGHLIRCGSFRHINSSHVSELRQLFNEFEDWRYRAEGFEKIRKVLSENNLRSEAAVANLLERVDEAQSLYESFLGQLEAAGKVPARRRQVMKADLFMEHIESGASPGCERIIIAGITSIMPWSHNALAAAVRTWPVTLWLPKPSDHALDPVRTILKVAGQDEGPFNFLNANAPDSRPVSIHHATGMVEEAAAALNLVDEAIAGGMLPADIGVLVTNDHEYGRPLRALLNQRTGNKKNFSYNAAITNTFAVSQTGGWLAALAQLQRRGEDAASLTAFLMHPVTVAYLKAKTPEYSSRPAVLLRGDLIRAMCHAGVESGMLATASALAERHGSMAATLGEIYQTCRPFLERDYEATLSDWITHLNALKEAFQPTGQEDKTSPGLRLSVEAALVNFCETVGGSMIRGERADASVFFDIMATHLLTEDIRDTGDQLAGVQILSIEEARFVPFRLLIILGCNEGSFPRSIPRDYLFDNYLKTKIGLPGWQAAEAIELSTFRLLRARTPNLHLFYTENPADGLKIRSRIIDDLRRSGNVREYSIEGGSALAPFIVPDSPVAQAAENSLAHRVAVAGQFPGDRTQLLKKLSATSLEALLKCPYRFLLRQLGVIELELPEEDDLRKEGDWLHAVLEAFFKDLDFAGDSSEFYHFAIERLNTLTDDICPPHLIGTEAWVQARTIGWPAFAEHISRLYAEGGLDRCGLGEREFKYTTSIPLSADSDDESFAPTLRGKIDSIDVPLAGMHVITDYKRSGSPAKNEVLTGRSPQLTLYAAALDRLAVAAAGSSDSDSADPLPEALRGLRLENTVIGYWSILKGEFTGISAGSAAKESAVRLGLISPRSKAPGLEATFQGLKEAVSRRRHEFLMTPSVIPDPGDCQFCNYKGICRKDDPDFQDMIRNFRGAAEVSDD